jgi:3-dehydroquinate dehydratase II
MNGQASASEVSSPSLLPLLVVLHGVNLDLLGERPAAHYGTVTLWQLEQAIEETAAGLGWRVVCHQTNHEGEFVELVHRYRREAEGMIVNPGAWTHYSYAIHDALEVVRAPVAEVHLSDVATREAWRRVSVVTDVAAFTISGRGPEGYGDAVRQLDEAWRARSAAQTEEE